MSLPGYIFTGCCQLVIGYCLLSTVYSLLSTVYCLLVVQKLGKLDIWALIQASALHAHPRLAFLSCLSCIISPSSRQTCTVQTSNIKVNNINLHCLTKAIAEHEAPQLILHQPIAVYRWALQSMVCRRCCPPTTTSLMCCLTASWTRSQNRSWCGCVGASCQMLPYTLTIGALPCPALLFGPIVLLHLMPFLALCSTQPRPEIRPALL